MQTVGIDVFAADEQQDHPVDVDRWSRLARQVLEDRGVRGEVEVSLLFVDAPAIAALNERFRSHEGPTDVLAFPIEDAAPPTGRYPDLGGTGPGGDGETPAPVLLGDVVICPAVAAANATRHEVTLESETALLVVHGLLHLLGMDHEVEQEAQAMEALERELLRRYHVPSGDAGSSAAASDGVGQDP